MTELFQAYLRQHHYTQFNIKAILFDMDGVLYDSMPAHAISWKQTFEELAMETTLEEFYAHEGRVGSATINLIFLRNLGRPATAKEVEEVYNRKTELFFRNNSGRTITHARNVLEWVQLNGIKPVLVTGSGQPSLLDRLDANFPGIFTPETMVTAFDVKTGKPHPEPFLLGLQKGGNLQPNEALAVENAPLGIESATAAGIFTIGVNTGPLPDDALTNAGAKLVFGSMTALLKKLPHILKTISTLKNNNSHHA